VIDVRKGACELCVNILKCSVQLCILCSGDIPKKKIIPRKRSTDDHVHWYCIDKALSDSLYGYAKNYTTWKTLIEQSYKTHGLGLFMFDEREDGIHMEYCYDKQFRDTLIDSPLTWTICARRWDDTLQQHVAKRTFVYK